VTMFDDLASLLTWGQSEPIRWPTQLPPITAERREAAGKIGDDNAPQTQGPEVDTRRLPDVQAS